jgi:hypothetical protein
MLGETVIAIWLAVVGVGVLVALWSIVDSYLDRRALRRTVDEGNSLWVVRRNLRSGWASLILHLWFTLVGLVSLRSVERLGASMLLFASGYILVALVNVRAIGLNQWERVRARRAR